MTAAVDLTFDLFACWAAVALVAVVLIAGWVTRTAAVVGVSMGLGISATLVLSAWLAYRIDGATSDGELFQEFVLLRLIAGVALILLALATWALVKLLRRDLAMRRRAHPVVGSTGPAGPRYDREWLLTLLQERAEASREKVAKESPAGTPAFALPPSMPNGKPRH